MTTNLLLLWMMFTLRGPLVAAYAKAVCNGSYLNTPHDTLLVAFLQYCALPETVPRVIMSWITETATIATIKR